MPSTGYLHASRVPATLEEARRMVAYNQDVIDRSASFQRVDRARRMLEGLRPHVERLEHIESARVAMRACPLAAGIEVVWNGAISRWTGLQPSDLAGVPHA